MISFEDGFFITAPPPCMQAVQVLFQPNVLGASYRFTPLAYRFGGNGFVAKVRHKSSPLTTETTPWIARRASPS